MPNGWNADSRIRRGSVAVVLTLLVALLASAGTDGAGAPAEAYRLLQKAVEARDAAGLAAIIHPDERAWMRRDVGRDGIEAVVARIPRGPITITYESADAVAAKVPSGEAVVFTRAGARWYVGGLFKEKAPANGQPIPAPKAYELLRAKVRALRPEARLAQFDTASQGIDGDGASLQWVAQFFTGTPGEALTCLYEKGEITGPIRLGVPEGRKALSDAEVLSYDIRPLREETIRARRESSTRSTTSPPRSSQVPSTAVRSGCSTSTAPTTASG